MDGGRRFATGATPFHIANVSPLTLCDVVALATPILVLPPILARFLQHVPGFPRDGALGLSGFAFSFHLSELAALPLALRRRDRRFGTGFLIAGGSCALQMALFATVGRSAGGREAVRIRRCLVPRRCATDGVAHSAPLGIAWARGRPRHRGTLAAT